MPTASTDQLLRAARATARRVAFQDALKALPPGAPDGVFHALQTLLTQARAAEAAAVEPLLDYCAQAIDRLKEAESLPFTTDPVAPYAVAYVAAPAA